MRLGQILAEEGVLGLVVAAARVGERSSSCLIAPPDDPSCGLEAELRRKISGKGDLVYSVLPSEVSMWGLV